MTNLVLAATLGGLVQPIDWTPTPPGFDHGVIQAVDGVGEAMWSVGIDIEQEPGGPGQNFHPTALRWDGGGWQQTVQPFPDGRLDDVLVRSTDDVWAVGATEMTDKDPMRPVLQHWTGDAWSVVNSPPLPVGESAQYTAIGEQGDDLLIGRYGAQASVLRYSDGGWQELPRTGFDLTYINDLKVVSGEIWAAGFSGVARFDGTTWHTAEMPVNGRVVLEELVMNSDDDIWAVGHQSDPELLRRPLALHYDGKNWTEVATPVVPGQFHDLELVDGKPVAVGGGPGVLDPQIVAEFDGDAFVLTTSPAQMGSLVSSVEIDGCIWAAGYAVADPDDQRPHMPFIAAGHHSSQVRDCLLEIPPPS